MSESKNLLGAPRGATERKRFEDGILSRFATEPLPGEKAVDYAYRLIDRQINKARGLLTFNAILFAGFRGLRPSGGGRSGTVTAGSLLALFACLPLLLMMYVSWGKDSDLATGEAEFRLLAKVSYFRSYLLTISLAISAAATALAVIEVIGSG